MHTTIKLFLKKLVAGCFLLLCIRFVLAGTQREEHLADSVASIMSRSVNESSESKLIFSNTKTGELWLVDMDQRLSRYVTSPHERVRILVNLQYEATRAGLDPQLVLGLIEVESQFRRYAISSAGAIGLMQVMPFWVGVIGRPEHNLFDARTNLRYGCTILRYYIDKESGNLFRALGRYNGSLGSATYPNAVLNAMRQHWLYHGAL